MARVPTANLGGMFGRTNFVSGRFISKSLPMNIQIATPVYAELSSQMAKKLLTAIF